MQQPEGIFRGVVDVGKVDRIMSNVRAKSLRFIMAVAESVAAEFVVWEDILVETWSQFGRIPRNQTPMMTIQSSKLSPLAQQTIRQTNFDVFISEWTDTFWNAPALENAVLNMFREATQSFAPCSNLGSCNTSAQSYADIPGQLLLSPCKSHASLSSFHDIVEVENIQELAFSCFLANERQRDSFEGTPRLELESDLSIPEMAKIYRLFSDAHSQDVSLATAAGIPSTDGFLSPNGRNIYALWLQWGKMFAPDAKGTYLTPERMDMLEMGRVAEFRSSIQQHDIECARLTQPIDGGLTCGVCVLVSFISFMDANASRHLTCLFILIVMFSQVLFDVIRYIRWLAKVQFWKKTTVSHPWLDRSQGKGVFVTSTVSELLSEASNVFYPLVSFEFKSLYSFVASVFSTLYI
jgi:hypothetical protein